MSVYIDSTACSVAFLRLYISLAPHSPSVPSFVFTLHLPLLRLWIPSFSPPSWPAFSRHSTPASSFRHIHIHIHLHLSPPTPFLQNLSFFPSFQPFSFSSTPPPLPPILPSSVPLKPTHHSPLPAQGYNLLLSTHMSSTHLYLSDKEQSFLPMTLTILPLSSLQKQDISLLLCILGYVVQYAA